MTYLEMLFVIVALLAVGWALRVAMACNTGINIGQMHEQHQKRLLRRERKAIQKWERERQAQHEQAVKQRKLEMNAKAPEHPVIFAAGQAIQVNAETELPEVIQIAPFGRWPTRDKKAVQVFNAEAAAQILSWFNFFPKRILRLARINTVKVWVGHPDFAPNEWPERIELGSITELMVDEKGLNARVQWNAEALEHVTKHKFPSVAWDCDVNDDGTETPAMLWSVGMWHKPNIKSVQPVINAAEDDDDAENPERAEARTTNEETKPETNMLKNIMAALVAAGIVKESDDENSILGAIGSMIQSLAWKREETARQAAMATQMRTALNAVADVADVTDDGIPAVLVTQMNAVITERDAHAATIAELNARISTLNAERISQVVERAIETGRATKADEARLITELNADFDGTVSKLTAQAVQLNTKPLKLGGMKPGVMDFQERQSQINTEVTRRMDEQHLSYDDAFNAVKADPKFAPLLEQPATEN
jgi:hypothetical protein